MRTPNAIGICTTVSIISTFVLTIFAPQQSQAYFANDFIKQLEGDARYVRRTLINSTPLNQSRLTLQRGRESTTNLRIYSTESYLSNLETTQDSTRLTTSTARSNQIMNICRSKYPAQSILCFVSNRRLAQRMNVAITSNNVRMSSSAQQPKRAIAEDYKTTARMSIPTVRTTVNSQRERSEANSLRVYSTDKYLETLRESRNSSRFTQSLSRSNQVMNVCREKYPDSRMLCFTRNHRLVQNIGVTINRNSVQ